MVKIVSYNVLADCYRTIGAENTASPYIQNQFLAQRRQDLITRQLGLNADILCNQEVDAQARDAQGNPIDQVQWMQTSWGSRHYNVLYNQRSSSQEGLAIFYKREFTVLSSGTIDFRDGTGRVAQHARFQTPAGEIINVFNVHLQGGPDQSRNNPPGRNNPAIKHAEVQTLMTSVTACGSEAVAVCGDFNTTPVGDANAGANAIFPLFQQAGLVDTLAGRSLATSFVGNGDPVQLDYIMTKNITLVSAGVSGALTNAAGEVLARTRQEPSDHIPVVFEGRLAAVAATVQPTQQPATPQPVVPQTATPQPVAVDHLVTDPNFVHNFAPVAIDPNHPSQRANAAPIAPFNFNGAVNRDALQAHLVNIQAQARRVEEYSEYGSRQDHELALDYLREVDSIRARYVGNMQYEGQYRTALGLCESLRQHLGMSPDALIPMRPQAVVPQAAVPQPVAPIPVSVQPIVQPAPRPAVSVQPIVQPLTVAPTAPRTTIQPTVQPVSRPAAPQPPAPVSVQPVQSVSTTTTTTPVSQPTIVIPPRIATPRPQPELSFFGKIFAFFGSIFAGLLSLCGIGSASSSAQRSPPVRR